MISYPEWIGILKNEHLPAAVVDLDAFDRNVHQAIQMVRTHSGTTVRLATKSLRVPELIRRAIQMGDGTIQGLMCFSAQEIADLHAQGFDDFLLAYPTLQPSDLRVLRQCHEAGARVMIVADHADGVRALAGAMKGVARPFPVLLDIDVSLRWLGGLIHLGVRRSRLRNVSDALALCVEISQHASLKISGLMAYEAQVAGLGDRNPFKPLLNPLAGLVRKLSLGRVAKLRAQIKTAMRSKGYEVSVVNGAGTGSLNYALEEKTLTEVTIGSGLLCSHLFDYYSNIRFEPACFFALPVVRASDPQYVTCLGGGYVASGEAGRDRLPVPYQPAGLQLVSAEGVGEVQTPLKLAVPSSIQLGAPILFRHAKTGELAEHFNEYLLISKGSIVGRARTYRGAGRCYL